MMEAGAEAAVGGARHARSRRPGAAGRRVDARGGDDERLLAADYAATRETPPTRAGSRKLVLGVEIPAFHPCRDGFVQVSVAFGGFGPVTTRMARWLVERGTLDPAVADVDWSRFPSSSEVQDAWPAARADRRWPNAIAPLSKTDIGTAARTYGFFAAPLMDMADVAAFEQYAQRGLWARQQLANGVEIDAPACFAQCSDHVFAQRRPRALSEHTQEVLAEAGLSVPEIQVLFSHHVL